jgi:hypothetical protein
MNNDDIDPKFKRIAINLNDWEEQDAGNAANQSEEEENVPTLTLGIDAVLTNGRQIRFAKEFSIDAMDDYIVLQTESEEDFQHASQWVNILSLAGAQTFSNPEDLTIFADPQGDWVDLYFFRLPNAIGSFGGLVWAMYTTINLWLKDTQSGEVLKQLRIVAPPGDFDPER